VRGVLRGVARGVKREGVNDPCAKDVPAFGGVVGGVVSLSSLSWTCESSLRIRRKRDAVSFD
jgi:hypothetical protein